MEITPSEFTLKVIFDGDKSCVAVSGTASEIITAIVIATIAFVENMKISPPVVLETISEQVIAHFNGEFEG